MTDRPMAKKKPPPVKSTPGQDPLATGRIELQALLSWIARLDAAADAIGVSRSAYIRMACNERMKADAQR